MVSAVLGRRECIVTFDNMLNCDTVFLAPGPFCRCVRVGIVEKIVLLVQDRTDTSSLETEILDRSREAASRYWNSKSDDDLAELVAMVCVARSFIDATAPGSGLLQDRTYLFECHLMQVYAIVSLFVSQKANPNTSTTNPEYHFRSIGTGEGKSIVICAICIMWSLMGCSVDVACFSKILAARDANNSRPWLQFFGVTATFGTIDSLIKVAPQFQSQIEQRSALVLRGQPLPAMIANATNATTQPRVLVIDEVDVLYSEGMVGQVWCDASQHKSEEISQLFLDIWEQKVSTVQEAVQSANGRAVQQAFPNLKLEQLLERVVPAAEEVRDGTFIYEVDNDRGRILRRSNEDGRLQQHVEPQDFFAALKEASSPLSSITKEQALDMIAVSTPAVAKHALSLPRGYHAIWGVSGTLASQFYECMASTLFTNSVPQKMEMPTSFAQKQTLTIQDPIVCGGDVPELEGPFDSNNRENSGYFLNIKKEIEAVVERSRAALVVFETQARLNAFREYIQGHPIEPPSQDVRAVKYLPPTSATDKYSVIDQTIRVAASRARVTLATRAFGRGSDFVCTDALLKSEGGLHVIQTFWSPDNSEEVQIKGRTCRQDNPGSYRQILWANDLKDIQAITNVPVNVASVTDVESARAAYFNARKSATEAQIADAAEQEEASAEFLQNLHNGTNMDSMIEYLNAAPSVGAGAMVPYKVVISCDVSGSMCGANIDAACKGLEVLLEALQERDCEHDEVEIHTFSSNVQQLRAMGAVSDVDKAALTANLKSSVGGGTVRIVYRRDCAA